MLYLPGFLCAPSEPKHRQAESAGKRRAHEKAPQAKSAVVPGLRRFTAARRRGILGLIIAAKDACVRPYAALAIGRALRDDPFTEAVPLSGNRDLAAA